VPPRAVSDQPWVVTRWTSDWMVLRYLCTGHLERSQTSREWRVQLALGTSPESTSDWMVLIYVCPGHLERSQASREWRGQMALGTLSESTLDWIVLKYLCPNHLEPQRAVVSSGDTLVLVASSNCSGDMFLAVRNFCHTSRRCCYLRGAGSLLPLSLTVAARFFVEAARLLIRRRASLRRRAFLLRRHALLGRRAFKWAGVPH